LILLLALLAGGVVGWFVASWEKRPWQLPPLKYAWLAVIAFLPQWIAIYLPATRSRISDGWAAACVISSQLLLLLFCWPNRRIPGIVLLVIGLSANLLVISANQGFMPISPEIAGKLVSPEILQTIPLGSRFGWKDILLLPEETHLVFLSDRILLPDWLSYQVAFSFGDITLAAGAYWAMAAAPLIRKKVI
jgi:hypothetical protein